MKCLICQKEVDAVQGQQLEIVNVNSMKIYHACCTEHKELILKEKERSYV